MRSDERDRLVHLLIMAQQKLVCAVLIIATCPGDFEPDSVVEQLLELVVYAGFGVHSIESFEIIAGVTGIVGGFLALGVRVHVVERGGGLDLGAGVDGLLRHWFIFLRCFANYLREAWRLILVVHGKRNSPRFLYT